MKSFQQFAALVRYHLTVSPWIWVFPLIIAIQNFIPMNRYYNNLQFAVSLYSPMWWMTLMIAAFIFNPDLFMRSRWMTAQTHVHAQCYNPEFLVTRAFDRPYIYWSRSFVFWLLIVPAIVGWLAIGIARPSLSLELFNKAGDAAAKAQFYLQQLPGSFIEKTSKSGDVTLQVPHGALYFKAAACAIFLAFAVFGQTLIFLICRLRYRMVIFWTVFIVGCFSPVILISAARAPMETAALYIINHFVSVMAAIVIGAVVAAFLGERVHRSLEYP